MLSNIPFEVPQAFAAGISNGTLTRIGTLIKDSGTGKIVAHVQETGLGQQLLGQFVGSPFSPLRLVDTASSVYSNVQLSQLRKMVEGLQMLQYANLGVAMAGIGVSVVGFAIVNKRLKGIEQSIAQLTERMDKHFQDLFERQLRYELSRIRGIFERIDIASNLSTSWAELTTTSASLTESSALLRGEIEYRLTLDSFDERLFTLLTRSMMLSDSARVESLLMANELDSAHRTASLIAENYSELFDGLSPYSLECKRQVEGLSDLDSFNSKDNTARLNIKELVTGLHDITDAAMTRPYMIETLDNQGIKGRDFIEQLRNETERPLLVLPC